MGTTGEVAFQGRRDCTVADARCSQLLLTWPTHPPTCMPGSSGRPCSSAASVRTASRVRANTMACQLSRPSALEQGLELGVARHRAAVQRSGEVGESVNGSASQQACTVITACTA